MSLRPVVITLSAFPNVKIQKQHLSTVTVLNTDTRKTAACSLMAQFDIGVGYINIFNEVREPIIHYRLDHRNIVKGDKIDVPEFYVPLQIRQLILQGKQPVVSSVPNEMERSIQGSEQKPKANIMDAIRKASGR